MRFNQFDNNTSDFFIKISNSGKSFNIEKAIVVLAVIKPSGKVSSQFVEAKNDVIYADLKPNMVDEIITLSSSGGAEKARATHSSTLAWKIPWTEESGSLQSMGR